MSAKRETAQDRRARRRARVEVLTCRRLSRAAIEAQVAKEFGCTTRTVRKDMEALAAEWAEEAEQTDRDLIRVELAASLNYAIALALNKTKVIRDAKGKPVLGPDRKPLREPDSDMKSVMRGFQILGRFYGIEQISIRNEVEVEVERLVDAVRPHMNPAAYADFAQALQKAMGVSRGGGPTGSDSGGGTVRQLPAAVS